MKHIWYNLNIIKLRKDPHLSFPILYQDIKDTEEDVENLYYDNLNTFRLRKDPHLSLPFLSQDITDT